MSHKPTPKIILGQILECFYEAHCKDMGLDAENTETSREYCRSLVEQSFIKTSNDFDNPTKESLIQVIDWLAKFSGNFRAQGIVEKHYDKVMGYINKLD